MISNLANKDTLGFLGVQAQYALVKSLIEDRSLFIQVSGYLNPAAFTEEPLQGIVKLLKSEYDSKGTIPSYKDLEYRLKVKLKTNDEMSAYQKAFATLKQDRESFEGITTATEIGINHLKTLEMKRILANAKNTLSDGGYTPNRLAHIIEEFQNIEKMETNEDELSPDDLLAMVMDSKSNEIVPTGIKEIDKAMNGGLPKGNIGLIVAGTGVGKTTFGSMMVMKAALAGSKVLHIFFEDSVPEIGRKYYATLTGRDIRDYVDIPANMKPYYTKEIMGNPEYRAALGRITPKHMANGETRVEDIMHYVRHQIAVGKKPDMIVIDYMSCLKLSSDKQFAANKEFELLEKATKALERFAHDENIAIWIEQQTNRNGAKADTKSDRLGNIQGSFRMVQPAAFAFYMEKCMVADHLINLYMDKSRGCEAMSWEGLYFNNGTCQIDFSETDNLPSTGEYNSAMTAADSEFKSTMTDIMQ